MKIRRIIPISGKDSLTTALVQRELEPQYEYEYIFNNTFAELPETYEWLHHVEQSLGIKIQHIGTSLEDTIDEIGMLPSITHRFCTRLTKIIPMEDYIGEYPCFVYLGIRADEVNRIGYKASKNDFIIPIYPLQKMGITLPVVWQILEKKNLLPPNFFWKKMYDLVNEMMGEENRHIIDSLQPWEYNALFSWRTRPNCYYCFYQRIYEWIGMLEHHPNLYYHAMEIEKRTGKADFYFNMGQSLRDIAARKDQIIHNRAKRICKVLRRKEKDDIDLLNIVSCGLYCGK